MGHAVIPSIASILYLFVIYATFVTTAISTPVIVAVVVLIGWLVATLIYSWIKPATVRLEEGEEL